MTESKVEKTRKPGRKKGCEKTGGRKKGTPNKNSLKIREALDEQGFNVMQEFIEAYQMLEPRERLQEIKFIMKFMYPQLSEVAFAPELPVTSKAHESTAKLLSMVSGGGK